MKLRSSKETALPCLHFYFFPSFFSKFLLPFIPHARK
uniref:Uncharacterized protein n=1 Tax=Anguilla anguilla TaxID=7936 RepID=A0A0E9R5T1_ANGAN